MNNVNRPRGPSLFSDLPRCGAKNRQGKPCQRPAGPKGRCYYHGGAPGSGGPRGELNGNYRHGFFTKEVIEERRQLRALLKRSRETIRILR
jgi:hypothetical protein